MSAIPYCDHHGWRWDGSGPSPCMGETISFWLAVFGCLCSGLTSSSYFTVQRRASLAGSFGAKVHGVQIALSLAQSIVALIGGVLSARPSGMLCGALLLHTLGWTVAWLASAFAISRNADLCKRLVWWWLGGAITNSVVLSSLHAASHRKGHGLPAEIGLLSWVSLIGNTLLVLLQLAKPELDDTESVYVRVLDHGTVLSAGTDWQAFWVGGGSTGAFDASGRLISRRRGRTGICLRGFFRYCCCCCSYLGSERARPNSEALQDAGIAWPIAGVEDGFSTDTLNDSLLGSVGLESSSGNGPSGIKSNWGLSRVAPGSANEQGSGRGLGRISRSLSSMLGRSDKAARQDRDGASEAGFQQRNYFPSNLGGASPLASRIRTAPGSRRSRDRSLVSPSYSVAFASRPPPQPAAPVFGVSITRWRLVDADGVPAAQGSPSDVASIDRTSMGLSVKGLSSSRRVNLRGYDAPPPPPREPPSASTMDIATKTGLCYESGGDETQAPETALTLQLELSVRSSGRGEIDWWGRHGDSYPGATSGRGFAAAGRSVDSGRAAAAAASDWRVWRSCPADVVALYDALALRFGPEFCGRVPRPQLRTPMTIAMVPSAASKQGDDEGSQSATAVSLAAVAAPHRADIQRDARTVGAFLRGLLGQRQFLSTAVMDFLAPPPRISLEMSESRLTEGKGDAGNDDDGRSWDGSDGGSLDSEDARAPQRTRSDFGRSSLNPFHPGTAEPSCTTHTGEAVAGAALASDYGAGLKRLAVRMRRAAPAGDRFVRLRRIGPAVTGDEVVRWLVSSSEECRGDRASAVRLGQDMVSNRLLTPLCAGYDEHLAGTRDASAASKQSKQRERDLPRSFDDGVGWLFAYAGEALRDPSAPPPPPPEVSVMRGSRLCVSVAEWIETSDNEGPHACFVVHTEVEVTQEAWDTPRRYRDFTQLRKRLLRLGIDLPKAMEVRGRSGGNGSRAGSLAPDLPKKTWRSNKFDRDHLNARRASLETYLKAAVEAALATPHLAGNLLMRFLDPDEANLRLLCDRNPFASWSPIAETPVARGPAASVRDVHVLGGEREDDPSVAREKEEAEDFNSLTDSLGGFG